MKITCPKCNSAIELPEAKFAGGPKFGIACKKCGKTIPPQAIEKLKKGKK